MSELLFVVEVSSESGIGHLMRCLALAQAAQERGINSVFFVPAFAQRICKTRHDWCGTIVVAEQNSSTSLSLIEQRLQKKRTLGIVVDGYHFDQAFIERVSQLCFPLLILDDVKSPICQYAHLITNPAGVDWKSDYQSINPHATLCLGPRYRLLRRSFRQPPALPLSRRHCLTISFGGSDPKHFTLPVLKAVVKYLQDVPIRVVTGPGFTQQTELGEFLTCCDAPVQHIHNGQDMADIWVNSRLTIAAAGGSQFELVACSSPSVLVVVADNQISATTQAVEQGWCEWWDARQALNVDLLAQKISNLWNDEKQLSQMYARSEHASYLAGTDNLLDALICYEA